MQQVRSPNLVIIISTLSRYQKEVYMKIFFSLLIIQIDIYQLPYLKEVNLWKSPFWLIWTISCPNDLEGQSQSTSSSTRLWSVTLYTLNAKAWFFYCANKHVWSTFDCLSAQMTLKVTINQHHIQQNSGGSHDTYLV